MAASALTKITSSRQHNIMNLRLLALTTLALSFFSANARAEDAAANPLAALIVQHFDTNSDAAVDQGEWQNGINSSFSDMDANSDGSISLAEADLLHGDLERSSGKLAADIMIVVIKQVLSSLDTNKDQLTSMEEFKQLANDAFGRMDADKNQSLSQTELAQLPVKLLASK
jgi:hypothetical protein